jgi:hypothetical protein
MTTLHILALETGGESYTIRLAAECWGMQVTLTGVGNSGQIVDYFKGRPDHDLILISGHGDERGLFLPELDDEIAARYPYNNVIRPVDFDQFLQLTGNTVINLSCLGGLPLLADTFLAHGARHYIGPVVYPSGAAALMYGLQFLYNYVQHDGDVAEAHRLASNHPDDRRQFKLYSRG